MDNSIGYYISVFLSECSMKLLLNIWCFNIWFREGKFNQKHSSTANVVLPFFFCQFQYNTLCLPHSIGIPDVCLSVVCHWWTLSDWAWVLLKWEIMMVFSLFACLYASNLFPMLFSWKSLFVPTCSCLSSLSFIFPIVLEIDFLKSLMKIFPILL